MGFEEGDDVVGERVVGVDKEDAVGGGVRHIFVRFSRKGRRNGYR